MIWGIDAEKRSGGYMEKLTGFIDHIIYRNETNGYTVLSLTCEKEDVICVGYFRTMDQGENIEAEGEFVNHPVYEEQFKISSYKIVPPSGVKAIERYLASGAIKGIGMSLAKRIVSAFKEDTFRIIEEEPERLAEIKGISERIARDIASQVTEKREIREVMIYLQQFGISNTLAVKIYNRYGMGIYTVMRENPYRLAEDIDGVGFKTADEIASKTGLVADSDYRIRSGVLYVLSMALSEGHMYLPMQMLIERTALLLSLPQESIAPVVPNLMMDKKVVIKKEQDNEWVYSMSAYYAELNCARMLVEINKEISGRIEMLPSEEEAIRKKVEKLEEKSGLMLDDLQMHAVVSSIKSGVFILSGGPGTGKTTTINLIIRYFEEEGMDLYLAAPTGRAAKRMTETTGYDSKTIHRLLELNGMSTDDRRGGSFGRNEDNPLEADVIIIDEMSMVDIFLFQSLLKAVSPGTRLILVGDVNQLPSVGPGQVLRDLINSNAIPLVMLKRIFRQEESSDIVVNAHRINAGEMLQLDNKSKDFFFLERNDVNVIYKHMVQLITEKLPGYVKCGPLDIQVLTPMRKGTLGVTTLNTILQKYLNPSDKSKKEYQTENILFRVGDKVMQIKNNYQLEWEITGLHNITIDRGLGVFNGDIGRITDINDYAQTITVCFDDERKVVYPYSGLDELELAYAITIHKSQGSEYPAVIMPLLQGSRLLFNRNLLYTGVTRAKNCVTLLGSRQTVEEMIQNENEVRRYTSLGLRIREMLDIADGWRENL